MMCGSNACIELVARVYYAYPEIIPLDMPLPPGTICRRGAAFSAGRTCVRDKSAEKKKNASAEFEPERSAQLAQIPVLTEKEVL